MKINLKVLKEQEVDDDQLDFGQEENLNLDIDAPAGEKADGPVKPEEDNILEKFFDFFNFG